MRGQAIVARTGYKGFDCDQPVRAAAAQLMTKAGFKFACRYIRRDAAHTYDLTEGEIESLFEAGIAVMPVQHVESAVSWIPSKEKGVANGQAAVDACNTLGIEKGVSVWLDLEGVKPNTAAQVVINYCNAWYNEVLQGGYIPAIYLGWHCGLTPSQLYHDLRFSHYWAAYNLNVDQYPVERGIQMKQHVSHSSDIPFGVNLAMQVDYIAMDNLGGLPIMYAPEEYEPAAKI